ncbi:MAG: alpha/beta hydrolase [bacterium]|nr:alpha/beta hydrolase [bacterium]
MSGILPEVVILHGWSRDEFPSVKWQPVVFRLQQAGVKVSALRLPGFELPLEKPWGVDEYIAWLAEQLSEKQDFVLVGHSFGGHLAATYAARFPKKVSRLVLIASAGFRSRTLFARLKRTGFYHLAKLGKQLSDSNTLRTMLHRLARERDYLEANAVMRETMRLVIAHEIDADLPNITVPTTIIWGANDKVTPLEFAERLQAGIPSAKLEVIAGARHGVPFTDSEVVVKKILEVVHV